MVTGPPFMIKVKMSDAQVVQQVLNLWNPFDWGQFDEYTGYVFPIIDLLKNKSSEGKISKYLEHIRFNTMESTSMEKSLALPEIDFYSWSLKRVWESQLSPSTNIRLVTDVCDKPNEKRKITPLEKIQYALISHDCFREIKYWLYGADNLSIYDQWAIDLLELLPACNSSELNRHESDFRKETKKKINKYIKSMWEGDDYIITEIIYQYYYQTHDAKIF